MRYERKFPSNHMSAETLERLIRGHPLGFRKVFPDRQINNIYFDTPSWTTFYENLAGISDRTKYRLRWYGLSAKGIGGAQFELKKKENLLGSKIIYPVKREILWEQMPILPREIPEIQQNSLDPILVNSYKRAYYESDDGIFRLTLDQELSFAPYLKEAPKLQNLPKQLSIVELKYDQNKDVHLDDFTQYWPLRLDRCSKYVLGMQLVYG